jgi:hypothetical protein
MPAPFTGKIHHHEHKKRECNQENDLFVTPRDSKPEAAGATLIS